MSRKLKKKVSHRYHYTITPAFRRLRQKGHGFLVSLGYIMRDCFTKQNKTQVAIILK